MNSKGRRQGREKTLSENKQSHFGVSRKRDLGKMSREREERRIKEKSRRKKSRPTVQPHPGVEVIELSDSSISSVSVAHRSPVKASTNPIIIVDVSGMSARPCGAYIAYLESLAQMLVTTWPPVVGLAHMQRRREIRISQVRFLKMPAKVRHTSRLRLTTLSKYTRFVRHHSRRDSPFHKGDTWPAKGRASPFYSTNGVQEDHSSESSRSTSAATSEQRTPIVFAFSRRVGRRGPRFT